MSWNIPINKTQHRRIEEKGLTGRIASQPASQPASQLASQRLWTDSQTYIHYTDRQSVLITIIFLILFVSFVYLSFSIVQARFNMRSPPHTFLAQPQTHLKRTNRVLFTYSTVTVHTSYFHFIGPQRVKRTE